MNPKWLVAVSVALGALIEIIDTSIINVALPQMQATLGATLTQVSWVITSYAIANVIVLPLAAWLGHRFGRKRYFLFSLFGFTAASMMCGMSTSLPMLVLARLLQGLTGGGLVSKAQTILFETFPREEQPVAQAFFGAIVIAGPAIGPTLGGYLVTNYAWQWIFFINLPIGVAAVFMVSTFLPDDDPADRIDTPTDWTALLMLAVGLGCLQTFLEEGNADDWFDSWFIRCMALGAVFGVVAFVRRQLRSDAPIVDLKVLREGSLAAGCVLGVVVGASLYGALFCVPIFAQTQLRFTSEQTGWLLLPGALASAVAIQVAGRAARRSDPRLVLVGGASVLIVSLVWIAGLMSPQTSEDDLYWPLIVRSIGTVLMFLPLQLAAIGSVPRPHIAAATGIFNLMRQLGGSVGVAALATVLDRRITFHAQVVGDHLVATDPRVLERVAALTRGFAVHDPARAHAQALAALSMQVRSQASVLAFADTFLITAGLLVLTLPLVALLKAPTAAVEPGGH